MKLTARQKRLNLLVSFGVVLVGALVLWLWNGWQQPMPRLERALSAAGYPTESRRGVDAGELDGLSDQVDGLMVGSEQILVFTFPSFDDAAAAQNQLMAQGLGAGQGSFLVDRYLLVYTGSDAGLSSALAEAEEKLLQGD